MKNVEATKNQRASHTGWINTEHDGSQEKSCFKKAAFTCHVGMLTMQGLKTYS